MTEPESESSARPKRAQVESASRLLAQLPRLPWTALPRASGLLLTLLTALGLEVLGILGLRVPMPAAVLLLVVSYATYLDGPRVGAVSATVAVLYTGYTLFVHPDGAPPDDPLTTTLSLVVLLAITVAFFAGFRARLDALLANERRLLREAEAKQSELASALASVERAQEAVRLQARLLEAVGQAVVATDVAGRIVYWNGPAADLFRMSAKQAARQLVTEVMPEPAAREGTLARLRRGESWAGEMEVGRPDGSRVTVMVNDSPIRDEAGHTMGLVRIATDVTARKHVERAQRLLAEAGAALAASMDYESTIRTVARLCVPTFADFCLVDVIEEDGTTRRIEAAQVDVEVQALASGMTQAYAIDPQSNHPVAEVIRTGLLRFFPTITAATLQAVAYDERHAAWLERFSFRSGIIAPLRAGGRTLGAISFYRDATQPAYDQRDLLLAEELASRAANAIHQARLFESAMIANRAKSDFLAVMSHELRTPLTTVTGYTDLMLAGVPDPLPERHRSYVQRIRLAATHLLSLIEHILVFARLELGRERAHAERIRVADIVREAAGLMEPVASERGIQFHVAPPDGETVIESDPTKLRQILLNLLANAVKFTDEGEVSLTAVQRNGDIVFEVRDTGIGISAEHLKRIFDPFWQVDQSSTRRAGGAGLGLSVTRKLARVLGGDVTVESHEGQGTTFFVRVPMRWSAENADTTNPSFAGPSA
jgi:PAS domain S-box-containing protein